MMDKHRLLDYLAGTYGNNLFIANGETYPVYAYAVPPAATIDTVLVPGHPAAFQDKADYALYDASHLETLKRTRAITNGITWNLHRFHQEDFRIEARLGYYFDMLATCDALDQELRRYARGEQAALPRREQFHQVLSPQAAMTHGIGRAAVIGVATLTVFHHDGEYRYILAQRGANLGVGAGLYHIVPAFVFQPSGPEAFYPAEWSLRHHVLREFGEELFGMPEFDAWDGAQSTDYFYGHPPVADLLALLESGLAEIHLTGMAFNPLNLRLEVAVLLIIHDRTWYSRVETQLQAAVLTERQNTYYIPVQSLHGLPDDLPMRMAPHGAAAMWLGLQRARNVIRARIS